MAKTNPVAAADLRVDTSTGMTQMTACGLRSRKDLRDVKSYYRR